MIDTTGETAGAPELPILWWFFDSEGHPPQPARGGWHADELILEKSTPRGIAAHRFAVADGLLNYRVRVGLDQGTEWADVLSGTYRRISGH